MKIDRIQVDGFGRLRNLDTGAAPLESLVVVLGPNEAGKSTLFTFLTTALYGFQPASRERNPHTPWGADEAAGRVRIRLDGGGCAEVERRLRSQATARLTLEGKTTDLRNLALPWVEHVPRAVFRQVFAVTLADLASLDEETWARIQDNLVGSMGASDLRSARSAAAELEREAGEIWRPNRRGNQRLREVQAAIRSLRARRSAAYDRDAKVRALVQEREGTRDRLREVREQRQRERAAVDRVQSLLPVKQQLERIASLRAQGGARLDLQGLPDDPPARLAELELELGELEGRGASVEEELTEREAALAGFDDRAKDLLGRREEIARLVARAAGCAPDRARALELDGEIRDLEARLDVAAEAVLEGSWRDASSEALVAVPIELLRDRVERARRPSQARGPEAPGAVTKGSTLAALTVGLALLGWGLLRGALTPTAFGAGLSAVAFTVWLVRGRDSSQAGAGSASPDVALEVAALVSDVPIRAGYLHRPGEALVSGLERLQDLLRERGHRVRALEAGRTRVAEVDAYARRLAQELRLEAAGDADLVARSLDREVRRAERLRDARAAAESESRRLRREMDTIAGKVEARRPALAALRDAGAALSGDDPPRGLELARARLGAHRRADQLEEELERAHPNLDELKAAIETADRKRDPWAVDDDDLARQRARIEALEEEVERLVERAEALDRDAAHLRDLETVDAVDSEIVSLREAEAQLARDRDRKWVLAQLLREADRRFREEHQPDLVRRAGSYLAHLTDGRYERLVVDESAESSLFHLVGPGLPAPVALAPPVSTGTLEQAYLSLRLAIVDHLDQGGERLPLFVDEVFVNWDRERRDRGLEVLAGVSKTRQVFVFTCHPGVAEELEQRGGRILRLGREA